jgi:hypothetical protein
MGATKIACKFDENSTCVIYPTDKTGSYCVTNCDSRAAALADKVKKPMTVEPHIRKELRVNNSWISKGVLKELKKQNRKITIRNFRKNA